MFNAYDSLDCVLTLLALLNEGSSQVILHA
jgi:hypothetical protein